MTFNKGNHSVIFFNTSHLPMNWFYKELILALRDTRTVGIAIPDPASLDSELLNSVNTHFFSVSRKPSAIRFLLEFPRVLREIGSGVANYDVIVSNNLVAGLYLAFYKIVSRDKRIWVHWFTGQIWSLNRVFWLSPFFWADILIYKFAHRVAFDSPSQFEFFDKYSPVQASGRDIWLGFSVFGVRRAVLSSAVSSHMTVAGTRVDDERAMESLVRFGYVGRISSDKGIQDLFFAFEKLRQKGLAVQFDCWGALEDRQLEEKLKSSDLCRYHGPAVDVSDCFRSIDFLLIPSLREGFGNVVLEASLFGVRAICRDIYGLRDVSGFCESIVLSGSYVDGFVTRFVDGAFFVSPGEKKGLARKMLRKYETYLGENRLKAFYGDMLGGHMCYRPTFHRLIEESAL